MSEVFKPKHTIDELRDLKFVSAQELIGWLSKEYDLPINGFEISAWGIYKRIRDENGNNGINIASDPQFKTIGLLTTTNNNQKNWALTERGVALFIKGYDGQERMPEGIMENIPDLSVLRTRLETLLSEKK